MSGGASLPSNPTPAFQYPNQPQAAQGALQGIQGVNTNPSGSYNAGASTQAGSALAGATPGLVNNANSALGMTAFNPALYGQEFQQQQDQTNVANAQNGVAGTPYGAGLSNQANQNFNNQWNQQQVGLENTAANSAATLLGAGAQGAQTGTAVGQAVPGFSNQQLQQMIGDYLAYLQGGTSASTAATGQYSAEANAAIANQGLSNQALSGLGNLGGNILGALA